jgi:hypothetical protein
MANPVIVQKSLRRQVAKQFTNYLFVNGVLHVVFFQKRTLKICTMADRIGQAW